MTDGGRYVYVFSLMGETLRKYELDHVIYGMFVDEQCRTIVATDVNRDEPISEYDMSRCNKKWYKEGSYYR